MKKHFFDGTVCAAVILAAALLVVFPKIINRKEWQDPYLEISVNGKTEKILPISKDELFVTSSGVTFEIKDNKVRIVHSDCPDRICENTMYIDSVGETIVCLPNKTVVKICADKVSEVDGIV